MPLSKYPAVTTKHFQTTASAQWTIKHAAPGYPLIDVYVNMSGVLQKIIPSEVVYVDENTATVSFSEPRAGFATVTV